MSLSIKHVSTGRRTKTTVVTITIFLFTAFFTTIHFENIKKPMAASILILLKLKMQRIREIIAFFLFPI